MRHPIPARPTGHGQARSMLVAVCCLLGACNATGDTRVDAQGELAVIGSAAEAEVAEPALVARLPARLASFDFAGYRHFGDGSGGYSFRYRNPAKKRLADVYVYPVAEQNAELAHRALVLGSTRATLRAIGEAVEQGLYANFKVVDSATRGNGIRIVSRVQATYLRENLASYTMLYQSEYRGTLMKIRLSMPDNESNRTSAEWDAFAEHMFALVIEDIGPVQTLSPVRAVPADKPAAPAHVSRTQRAPGSLSDDV